MGEKMRHDDKDIRLNRLLDHLPTPAPVDTAYIDRIMAAAQTQAQVHNVRSPVHRATWREWFFPLTGLVFACTLGVMMGLSSLGRSADDMLYLDAGDYIVGDATLSEDLEALK